jgi:hypothetical protein
MKYGMAPALPVTAAACVRNVRRLTVDDEWIGCFMVIPMSIAR